ncbi:microtubule-associated protein Jupiter isoform X2 [Anabrus simplex]
MIQPPGGDSHDLWGAEFKGSPCHNRVLKPPGGGTSDIFGAPEPVQNSPRRVQRSQMQSSLFGPPQDATDTPVRSKPGNDSYNRLFGPVDPRPPSASKNHQKSNIMLNNEEPSITPAESKSSDSNSSTISETDSQDGNPVTGEGYAAVNGDKESSAPASNNSAPVTNGSTHSAPPQRNRVPPGGYSSGLW